MSLHINEMLEIIYNDENDKNLNSLNTLEYFEKIQRLCSKLNLEQTNKNMDILFDSLITPTEKKNETKWVFSRIFYLTKS